MHVLVVGFYNIAIWLGLYVVHVATVTCGTFVLYNLKFLKVITDINYANTKMFPLVQWMHQVTFH